MCSPKGQTIAGAVFYTLGLLVAGGMMLGAGAEFNKTNTDNDKLRNLFWVYFAALLLSAVGMILEFGEKFCGGEVNKDTVYFGGLFALVSIFGLASFGLGLAIYFDDSQYLNPADYAGLSAASSVQRQALGFLSGVAAIFLLFGSLLVLKDLITCNFKNFVCDLYSTVQFTNMLMAVLLVIFWFLWAAAADGPEEATKLTSTNPLEAAKELENSFKDLRTYSYLIGVVYLIMGLTGLLKLFS